MRVAVFVLLAGTLCGQRVELLRPGLGGRVARDPSGAWIVCQSVSKSDPADRDVRVRKFTSDFSATVFDVRVGGSRTDDLRALRVSPGGDIYLLGITDSRDFPASPGALWPDSAPPDGFNSFLVRLDAAGNVRTSSYIASPGLSIQARNFAFGPDASLILGADAHGDVAARFGDTAIPGSGPLLFLKLDAAGNRVVGGTRFGGGQTDTLAAIQVFANGDIYAAGTTSSDSFPVTANAFLTARPGGTCRGLGFFSVPYPCPSGFVARLDGADFRLVTATYLGETSAFNIRDLAVDRDGSPYVTGWVSSGGAGVPSSSVAFVTKLTPDLSALRYSTLLHGSRAESASSILVDDAGRALIAGSTNSPDFPVSGAFQTACGPDVGLNPAQAGFISRLDADGLLNSSARLPEGPSILGFLQDDQRIAASAGDSLAVMDLDSRDAPSVACVVNGANFRPELFLAPGQLLTLFGGNLPADPVVLFDGLPARLLYASPTQINAVVPRELAGSRQTTLELDDRGVRSNARIFEIRDPNPTVKLFVSADGKLVDRGNPLADVRLSDGTPNGIENPARHGEPISIYTTGLDLRAPIEVHLGNDKAELLEAFTLPGSLDAVAVLRVRMPDTCCGGVRVITITNGDQRTDVNPGFVWLAP